MRIGVTPKTSSAILALTAVSYLHMQVALTAVIHLRMRVALTAVSP